MKELIEKCRELRRLGTEIMNTTDVYWITIHDDYVHIGVQIRTFITMGWPAHTIKWTGRIWEIRSRFDGVEVYGITTEDADILNLPWEVALDDMTAWKLESMKGRARNEAERGTTNIG